MIDANTISSKLLSYSKKHNVNHQMILIRFFHERLLYRVSISEFCDQLMLKGGSLLFAIHGNTARPTADIDFLGSKISNNTEEIINVFRKIIDINTNDSILFDTNSITAIEINEQNQYAGVRVKVMAMLGNIKQNLQIDIGFGDVINPSPVSLHNPILLQEFEAPIILAYTNETVIAEKLHAIIVLAQLNSRMKDFYDIYTLLNSQKINSENLKQAIEQTFSNRNTTINFETIVFTPEFYNDASRNRMWNAFLLKINADYFRFETVVISIERFVKDIFK